MSRRRLSLPSFVLAGVLAGAASAATAADLPGAPPATVLAEDALAEDALAEDVQAENAARTEAEVRKGWSDLLGRALVADYRGRRTTAAPAEPTAEAALLAYAATYPHGLWQEASRERLARLARRALLRGEDALLLLVAGDAAFMDGDLERGGALLRQGVAKLAERPVGAFVSYFANLRLASCLHHAGDAAAYAALTPKLEDMLAAAIADPIFAGLGQPYYLRLVSDHFGDPRPPRAFVARIAKVDGAAPYSLRVLDGLCHAAEAWAARGDETGDKVTRQGWRDFETHLEAARGLLVAAHESEPRLPEASAALQRVLGGTGAAVEARRAWLDLTTAAQYDYTQAHESFLWFSLPRWGGTHAAMLRICREWVAEGRYDTDVPALFRNALRDIARDYGRDFGRLFAQPAVQKTLQELHEGYLAALAEPHLKRREVSMRVVELTLGGRDAEAAALDASIDGGFDPAALAWYGLEDAWLRPRLAAHSVPAAGKAVLAEDVFADAVVENHVAARAEADPVRNAIPVAIDRATRRTFEAAQAAWFARCALAAYDARGHRDVRWDAAARAGLEAHCLSTNTRSKRAAVTANRDRLQGVRDDGCEDPLVRWCLAVQLDLMGEGDAAFEHLGAAVEGLREREYPISTRLVAERRWLSMLRARKHDARASALTAALPARAAVMASEAIFHGADARFFVTSVVPEGDIGWGCGLLDRAAVDRIAADPKVDPWVRHMVAGLWHCNAAARMHIRNLPDDRAEYHATVRLAATNLEAAFTLRPEFPEAAAAMVVVRMLEPDQTSPRQWFERAVEAQVDYTPAYRNLLWALRPEHGGSIAAMYRFGAECLDTGRFDTEIPMQFLEAVTMAARLAANWRWVWASPGCVGGLERLTRGYSEAAPRSTREAFLRNGRAPIAWAGGRYEAAAAAWREAGERLDPAWLTRLGVPAEAVEADLRAVASEKR